MTTQKEKTRGDQEDTRRRSKSTEGRVCQSCLSVCVSLRQVSEGKISMKVNSKRGVSDKQVWKSKYADR